VPTLPSAQLHVFELAAEYALGGTGKQRLSVTANVFAAQLMASTLSAKELRPIIIIVIKIIIKGPLVNNDNGDWAVPVIIIIVLTRPKKTKGGISSAYIYVGYRLSL
jgi:hypothetical protein